MKNPAVYALSIIVLGLFVPGRPAYARPVDFNEISLMVRIREDEATIKDDVVRRKLMHPLTASQENTLKAQGASDGLIASLRNSNLVANKDDVATLEAHDRQMKAAHEEVPNFPHDQVHVFNVAFGHPINLSQWGGADYEIAFYSYRIAGEDYIQPAMIDNIRTGTDVFRTIPLISEGETFARTWYPTNEVRNWRFTPYDGRGDLKDNRFNFSDSVATSSHEFARPLHIDWDSPVFIEGEPYTFYPVYGAGRVSLYYIGRASSQSATVAIVSHFAL